MSQHIDEYIEPWLAGRLSAEQERELDQHTRQCERCTELYRQEAEAIADVARAMPSVEPDSGLKSSILGDLSPAGRFRRFVGKTAELIDVSAERARQLLAGIDEATNWEDGPAPAVSLFHIDGGPKTAEAIVGFIKIEPGETFPEHKHHGKETVYVLQGGIRDSGGERFRPGDVCVMPEGTEHHLVAEQGPPLVYLVVVETGVSIGDYFIGPDDPEL
ncbi:MAG: dimethylsulfonioproprionate lyase family protein [Myxococcota bacterium]